MKTLKIKKLYTFPYILLIKYHVPLGNTIDVKANGQMLQHIVGVRNMINIFSMDLTISILRKALTMLNIISTYEGDLLIYTKATPGLRIYTNRVCAHVYDWVPGLLSNYNNVAYDVKANTIMSAMDRSMLKRSQITQLMAVTTHPVPEKIRRRHKILHLKILKNASLARYVRPFSMPSISFSTLDDPIWLNDCACAGVLMINTCDSTTNFEKIDYPIIANQRSQLFAVFLAELFSEVHQMHKMSKYLRFLNRLYIKNKP